ncbi:MAG: peptide deformylase [Chloroflexi bacterium]|jgi:peptide deformylase|nr:peptide deformylase [Chloroflexota bacterium]
MTVREVITIGDPRLRQSSDEITEITPEIEQLIDDMIETMHEEGGMGLAAVQVGEMQRIILVELPEMEMGESEEGEEIEPIQGQGELYVVLNPRIVRESKETEVGIEGCLSIPGYVGEVERAVQVTVRGRDRHGKKFRLRPHGLLARVFQHEIDHCNGVLYVDKLTDVDKMWIVVEGTEEEVEATQEMPAQPMME